MQRYKMTVYNYKTESHEEEPDGGIKDWSDYIPQDPAVQEIYRLYIKIGDVPTEAARKTLCHVVGEDPNA